jgi:hypothetical protein
MSVVTTAERDLFGEAFWARNDVPFVVTSHDVPFLLLTVAL